VQLVLLASTLGGSVAVALRPPPFTWPDGAWSDLSVAEHLVQRASNWCRFHKYRARGRDLRHNYLILHPAPDAVRPTSAGHHGWAVGPSPKSRVCASDTCDTTVNEFSRRLTMINGLWPAAGHWRNSLTSCGGEGYNSATMPSSESGSAVTLILSCITREYVVQASDRKVTAFDGSWFENQRNKVVFFCGHSAFAYTGLASLAGLLTEEWLTLELGAAKALTDGIPHIAGQAKVALRRIPFRTSMPTKERNKIRRLAFVNVAFMLDAQAKKVAPQHLRPAITVVSNFFRPPNVWLTEAEQDFMTWHRYLADSESFVLFSSGQSLRPDENKDLNEQLHRAIERAATGYPVARLLARQIKIVSDRNDRVGPNVMCAVIPREAVIRDVGQPPTSSLVPLDTEAAEEADFFHYPPNDPPRKTYIYLPASLSDREFFGPNYVCEGVLIKDIMLEMGPGGTVSAKASIRDFGHPENR